MDLGTTNTWLAIIAVASALQVLMFIGIGVGGFLAYRRVMQLVNDLEARQIAPLREKVDGILLDVKGITSKVHLQTERVSHAVSGTMEKVDHTAHAVGDSVRDKVGTVVGMVRGARAVIMSLLASDHRNEPVEIRH
jgi:hypothetical protein